MPQILYQTEWLVPCYDLSLGHNELYCSILFSRPQGLILIWIFLVDKLYETSGFFRNWNRLLLFNLLWTPLQLMLTTLNDAILESVFILDVHIQSGSAPGQTPCGKIRNFFHSSSCCLASASFLLTFLLVRLGGVSSETLRRWPSGLHSPSSCCWWVPDGDSGVKVTVTCDWGTWVTCESSASSFGWGSKAGNAARARGPSGDAARARGPSVGTASGAKFSAGSGVAVEAELAAGGWEAAGCSSISCSGALASSSAQRASSSARRAFSSATVRREQSGCPCRCPCRLHTLHTTGLLHSYW